MTPEHLKPVPEEPLRTRGGRLRQLCVVTRYHQKDERQPSGMVVRAGRQKSQDVEWRDVREARS